MQHARELLAEEGFTANENEIKHRHALAEEMRQILLSEREAPTDEFYDIAEIVEKAKV
jgi:dsDNA-specific endonuclease/ATPase MutS2